MFIFVLSTIFFIIDFVVKHIITRVLDFSNEIVVIPGFLWLRLVHNRGAAFGIFQGKVFLLVLIAIFFIAMMIWWIRTQKLTKAEQVAMAMIIGGALCNLYDRIVRGYVVDYFDLGWFPVFNISDSFICVGCFLYIIFEFLKDKKLKENKNESVASDS